MTREREREAIAELALSEELQRQDQAVTDQIARAHHRNQFSEMIRDALQVGYHRPPRRGSA